MEPPVIESLVTTATTIIASKGFAAAVAAARHVISENLGKKAARQLAVRYWGVVLFEMRRNLTDTQTMLSAEDDERYAIIDLKAWDSLFETLCKLTPVPSMIASIQDVNTSLLEIQRALRTAVGAPPETANMGSLGSHTTRGGRHQWEDAHALAVSVIRTAPAVFNAARSIVADAGRDAHGNDWQKLEAVTLPEELPIPG